MEILRFIEQVNMTQNKNVDIIIVVVDRRGCRLAAEGHQRVIRVLLKGGAAPSIANNDGITPLHKAAMASRCTLVVVLVRVRFSMLCCVQVPLLVVSCC
jgi:hypothetical protein